jgi:hypothetical protein
MQSVCPLYHSVRLQPVATGSLHVYYKAMSGKWNDPLSQHLYTSAEVFECMVNFFRKEFADLAEKERLVGFSTESASGNFATLALSQSARTRTLITTFVSSILQIENTRKFLYHRLHLMAVSGFQGTLDHVRTTKPRLKERDQAIGRYNQALTSKIRATKPDPNLDVKVARETANLQSMNLQAIQSAASLTSQVHQDLASTLTAFAHAHMEMYVKTIEMWTKLLEEIEDAPLEDDVDDLLAMMPNAVSLIRISPTA